MYSYHTIALASISYPKYCFLYFLKPRTDTAGHGINVAVFEHMAPFVALLNPTSPWMCEEVKKGELEGFYTRRVLDLSE
jgi:hypothetical protein